MQEPVAGLEAKTLKRNTTEGTPRQSHELCADDGCPISKALTSHTAASTMHRRIDGPDGQQR
eukprot:4950602-Prymnesium_polylepis.1